MDKDEIYELALAGKNARLRKYFTEKKNIIKTAKWYTSDENGLDLDGITIRWSFIWYVRFYISRNVSKFEGIWDEIDTDTYDSETPLQKHCDNIFMYAMDTRNRMGKSWYVLDLNKLENILIKKGGSVIVKS
jgi:hypothetical protein